MLSGLAFMGLVMAGRRVVPLSNIHLPPKSTGNTQEALVRPNMTEKLFTGTLSKNETKRNRSRALIQV